MTVIFCSLCQSLPKLHNIRCWHWRAKHNIKPIGPTRGTNPRLGFALSWLEGEVLRGWARSASGDTAEGIPWIEQAIRDFRVTGSVLGVPFFLALTAQALHLGNRTPEALAAIKEADALIEKYEQHNMRAELHRLRGVFLTAIGADETQIEASFRAAIKTAKEQFHWRHAQKRATQNTAAKKRARQEVVDPDYLFANS